MRIGIFGGSFSPVHEGHLALAKEAFSELNLDRVIFVPSFKTPLKKKEVLWPVSRRVALLKQAIRQMPSFSISLSEIERKGESYTVDTLEFFKKKFGEKATLYFLTGADSLKTLSRWRSLSKIFKLCRFVVMTRPGYELRKATRWPILQISFAAVNISSSALRKSFKFGKTRGLTSNIT